MHKIQKAKETRHLECLRQNYAHFPAGIVKATEEPDFIIQDAGQSIGIELTEWLRKASHEAASHLRAQESEQDKTVNNACKLYASRGLPPVDVAIRWFKHFRLTSKRRKELQHELATLVANVLPKINPRLTLENAGLPESPIPQEIQSVRIFRSDILTRSHWATHASDYVVSLGPQDIIEVIADKEPKLPTYQQKCSHIWLVVVLEGLHPSSFVDVPPLVQETVYETGFEKVLLLRYFEGQAVELHTKRINC